MEQNTVIKVIKGQDVEAKAKTRIFVLEIKDCPREPHLC